MFKRKKPWFYATIKVFIMLRIIYSFASFFLKSAEKQTSNIKETTDKKRKKIKTE